jgi:hypothetical protein
MVGHLDITVLTPSMAAPRVSHAVRTVVEDATSVDIISSDDCQGSADALRLVRDRIKVSVISEGEGDQYSFLPRNYLFVCSFVLI